MHLNLYLPEQSPLAGMIEAELRDRFPSHELHIYTILELLLQAVRMPEYLDCSIEILVPGTARELDRLIVKREGLRDKNLVLIVPESGPETISKGHLLRPRILLCSPVQVSEISDVVSRMIERRQKENESPDVSNSIGPIGCDGPSAGVARGGGVIS